MNRSEINRSLAKALAFADCGKFQEAEAPGLRLVRQLELAGVFKAGSVRVAREESGTQAQDVGMEDACGING